MEYWLGPTIREQRGDCLVRLADDVRKCVVYLGYGNAAKDSKIEPIGTAFWTVYGDPPGLYLVTARHVAEEFGSDPFVVRMNTKQGIGKNDYVDAIQWNFHPTDENIDIAVAEYRPPEWADIVALGRGMFLSDSKLKSKDTGAGDLAQVVGVFALLHGTHRNMPAVHTGHISLMAGDEPIPVIDWRDPKEERVIEVHGYLVEANTLPGTSGAPVFIRRSVELSKAAHGTVRTWAHGTVWLLGVWQGSWHGDPNRLINLPASADRLVTPIGMGVVVPTTKLIEVFEQEKLVNKRAAEKAEHDRPRAVTPEKATVPGSTDDNPKHREDFMRLQGAAARKQKQDD
jgi:hypothetical protein